MEPPSPSAGPIHRILSAKQTRSPQRRQVPSQTAAFSLPPGLPPVQRQLSPSPFLPPDSFYKNRFPPLGSDLARLVRIWRALIDHRLKPLELTQTHWVTLHNIHQLPPDQSQIQLAKAIGIEQPSLVRTLDQLEEKGLISRQTCASDRRAKRIKLTEKAEPLISEMEAVINKTRAEILHGISAEELEQLITLIAKLEHNIIELQAKG